MPLGSVCSQARQRYGRSPSVCAWRRRSRSTTQSQVRARRVALFARARRSLTRELDASVPELPCDTLASLQVLVARVRTNRAPCHLPIAFLSQVYSMLPNHAQVDHELEELVRSGAVRSFHMLRNTDVALVLQRDYELLIEAAKNDYVAHARTLPRYRAMCGAIGATAVLLPAGTSSPTSPTSPPPTPPLPQSPRTATVKSEASASPSSPGTTAITPTRATKTETVSPPSSSRPASRSSPGAATPLRGTATSTSPSSHSPKTPSPTAKTPSPTALPLSDKTRYDRSYDIPSPEGEIFGTATFDAVSCSFFCCDRVLTRTRGPDMFVSRVLPRHHLRSITERQLTRLLFGGHPVPMNALAYDQSLSLSPELRSRTIHSARC